jgi:PEP-CTERM motif
MSKTIVCRAWAIVLTFVACGVSHAGPVTAVYSDSGGGTANVVGFDSRIQGAGATVTTPFVGDTITEINGSSVSVPLFMSYTLHDDDGVISGSGFKVIGTLFRSETVNFSITSATIGQGVLDVQGVITSVITNFLSPYDFSPLIGTENVIAISDSSVNFADIVGVRNAHVNGANMMINEGVPEPSSIALLGLGIIGFVGLRRVHRRARAV